MDFGYDGWPFVQVTERARWVFIRKLPNESNQTDDQTDHQTPKCALLVEPK
jgi:hypothetical protein